MFVMTLEDEDVAMTLALGSAPTEKEWVGRRPSVVIQAESRTFFHVKASCHTSLSFSKASNKMTIDGVNFLIHQKVLFCHHSHLHWATHLAWSGCLHDWIIAELMP